MRVFSFSRVSTRARRVATVTATSSSAWSRKAPATAWRSSACNYAFLGLQLRVFGIARALQGSSLLKGVAVGLF